MPLGSKINGTIIESQQTINQRLAFNRTNDTQGQLTANLQAIFSNSPIHAGVFTNAEDDRSDLYENIELDDGETKHDLLLKGYAKLLNEDVVNGFGFSGETVSLNMQNEALEIDNGVAKVVGAPADSPQFGSANLNVAGDLNNPSAANENEASAQRNNNFGTDIPTTIGQYFTNKFVQEEDDAEQAAE